MKFNQRDIVFVDFPYTDLSGSKLRPALIISTELVNDTGDYICLQITSKEYNDGMFFKINEKHLTVPLKLQSGIRLNKIFSVNKNKVVRKISSFKASSFALVGKEFRQIAF
ncbi:MAG: hypothetical protein POELPBGB_02502 [Bacteroidia bacterium]|nr:hypothetical protein [Bacteroidia bacterium]